MRSRAVRGLTRRQAGRGILCACGALGCILGCPSQSFAQTTPVTTNKILPDKAVVQSQPAVQARSRQEHIEVVASRRDLTGRAQTASQGTITAKELQMRPAYRVGQILEAIPGLVVTTHSGEGKANQLLLRGFNLDHGTDLATFVDDMPVNGATNAHGQGYTDINFLIPELLGE